MKAANKSKHHKAIYDFMKAKNKLSKELFGHKLTTKKELKILLKVMSREDAKNVCETMKLIEDDASSFCPHCKYYGCESCPINKRTKECNIHPILEKFEKLSIIKSWDQIGNTLIEDDRFQEIFKKLKEQTKD